MHRISALRRLSGSCATIHWQVDSSDEAALRRERLKKRMFSCGLEASLSVVGGKWKFLIIWQLAGRPRRFGELRRLVAGVTEKMLIQGLKELEKDGVVR